MSLQTHRIFIAGLATLLAALAGCGGGGGSTPTVGRTTPLAVISNDNGLAIAGEAARTLLLAGASDPFELLGAAFAPGDTGTLATTSGTSLCGDGSGAQGQATLSVTDNEPVDQLSVGDQVSFLFQSCFADPITLNGRIAASVSSIDQGTPFVTAPWQFGGNVSYQGFSIDASSPAVNVTINGEAQVSVQSTDNVAVSSVINLQGISVSVNGDNRVQNDLRISLDVSANNLNSTINVTGRLSLNAEGDAGGPLNVTTLSPLQSADDFPTSGRIRITGRNSSSVTLEAIGNGNVSIEIDADGNNVPDQPAETRSWLNLLSL